MKITIEHYGIKHSFETENDDLAFVDTMDLIKDMLKSIYHIDTINEYWEE